uniref:hypothetical protein n=1 Tax=Nonomuraea sp. CA-251285 TaxID=3240002 RepID=UPI003F492EBD
MRLTSDYQTRNRLPGGVRFLIRDIHQGEVCADALAPDGVTVATAGLYVPLVGVQLDLGECSLFLAGPVPDMFWDEWDLTSESTFRRRYGGQPTEHRLMPELLISNDGHRLWCLPTWHEEAVIDNAIVNHETITVLAGAAVDGSDRVLHTIDCGTLKQASVWPGLDALPVPPERVPA